MPKFIKRSPSKKPGIESYWPLALKRLFQSVHEVPWIGLTALCTLAGATVLFFYFRSINHFPSDFSSLIGLGVAAFICAGGLIAVFSFGLFAPAALYRHYAGDDYSVPVRIYFTNFERIVLPSAGLGLVCIQVDYWNCGVISAYGVTGSLLLIAGLVALGRILLRGGWVGLFLRVWAAVVLFVWGLMPLVVLSLLREVFTASWINFEVVFFTIWIVVILANVVMENSLKFVGVILMSVFSIAIIFFAVPAVTGKPGFFPTMVAKELGIRSDGSVKLQVSRQACELVASLQSKVGQPDAVSCTDQNWNEITAQVLSNVGDRWMLEVAKVGLDQPATLRFTLPRSEVQTVAWSVEKTEKEKPAVCPVD